MNYNKKYKKSVENKLTGDPLLDIDFLGDLSMNHLKNIEKAFEFIHFLSHYSSRDFNRRQIKHFLNVLDYSVERLFVLHEMKNEYDNQAPDKKSKEYLRTKELLGQEFENYSQIRRKVDKIKGSIFN